jgi:flagellar basal-body rod modification protein FlgD
MSTAPVVPSATSTTPPPTTNGLPSGQSLNNMFLQLLVAQLQNQDPTSPVDPSQFVGQLAQFSELSEVTSIYTLLQGFAPASSGTGTGSSGSTSPTSGNLIAAATNSPLNSLLNPSANPAASLSANSLAPTAAAAAAAMFSGAVPSAAQMLPNFSAPSLSALTGKIQGVF